MSASPIAILQDKLQQKLMKARKRKNYKPPGNFSRLIELVIKLFQFYCAFQVGIDLALASTSELFVELTGFLVLSSILTHSIIFYLWTYQEDKLPTLYSKISKEVFTPCSLLLLISVVVTQIISSIGQAAKISEGFMHILAFNQFNVILFTLLVNLKSIVNIYYYIVKASCLGVLLGLFISYLGKLIN